MAGFIIDLPALLSAVDQMSHFEQQMEQSLARAKAAMQTLGLSWQGEAAGAQQAAQEQWNSGAEELRAALGELRGIAEQAHGNYSDAASMNTQMWS